MRLGAEKVPGSTSVQWGGLRQVEVHVRVSALGALCSSPFPYRGTELRASGTGGRGTPCTLPLQEGKLAGGVACPDAGRVPSSVDSFGVSSVRGRCHSHGAVQGVCVHMCEQVWFLDLPGHYTPLFSCLIWTFWPQHSAFY